MVQPASKRLLTEANAATTYAARGRAKVADGIFAAISESLNAGRSAALQVQGDSTGNATDEWVYLTTQWLAAQHSTAHVKYKLWNDITQAYDGWTTVQAGASGERHAPFLGANVTRSLYHPQTAIPHVAGDIDIRARLSMDDWTPATSACIVARYGASGARGWKLNVGTGGAIDFTYTTDGITNIQKVSTALGYTDGSEGWIRITLDVDNGTGGHTWKAYKSTDGTTWTEVGSSVVNTGGAIVLPDVVQEFEIGGRGFVGEPWAGKLYEVQIRDGIDGKIISPQPIDSWIPRAASGAYVPGYFAGSPTLYVLNGSHPGSAYSYHLDTTRHPKMVHPYAGSLLFQSCSHNDSTNVGAAYLSSRDSWLALNDARSAGSQTVLITQNPQTAPIGADSASCHARRRLLLMAWGARKGLAVVDTYKAFQDDSRGLAALLQSDGIHPNTTGSQLWADTVKAAFSAA